jgi:hypothetical protein
LASAGQLARDQLSFRLPAFFALIDAGRSSLSARWTKDFGLVPQAGSRSHHAIAAVRTSDLDLGGVFQRMIDQVTHPPASRQSYAARAIDTWMGNELKLATDELFRPQ